MASYTMRLQRVCDLYGRENVESWFKDYDLTDYLTQDQIDVIEEAGIWNKSKLAKKIVDHYFMHEIGYETPALFQNRVKVHMQEIMEDYLPVIYSNAIQFDPLVNVDYTETFEREIEAESTANGTSNSTSGSEASGLNVNSDTPQGQISKTDILAGSYASQTNASETESSISNETTTENTGNSTSSENYTKRTKGNSGVSATAQALIKQYRDIIRAVDREIIEALNINFMGIF